MCMIEELKNRLGIEDNGFLSECVAVADSFVRDYTGWTAFPDIMLTLRMEMAIIVYRRKTTALPQPLSIFIKHLPSIVLDQLNAFRVLCTALGDIQHVRDMAEGV
ncbi:hypothetical protein FACS1894184_09330 [Clostridia bacterium]|nr:hypothetical protein FACS1894184_09330 [Clostridia bacterium]